MKIIATKEKPQHAIRRKILDVIQSSPDCYRACNDPRLLLVAHVVVVVSVHFAHNTSRFVNES